MQASCACVHVYVIRMRMRSSTGVGRTVCGVIYAVPPMRRRSMHGLAKNENNYTRYRYALYNIYVIRIYKADDNELICILRISSCFFFFLYSNHSAGRHCRIKISKVLYLDCCPLNVFVADRHHSINYSGWQITTKRWLVHQCHMWLLMQHTFVWRNVRKKQMVVVCVRVLDVTKRITTDLPHSCWPLQSQWCMSSSCIPYEQYTVTGDMSIVA